jgi:predicted aspartyl protease
LKKRKPRRKKSGLQPIVPAIAAAVAVHLAVILFFLYEPGHSNGPSKKSLGQSQLSSEKKEHPNLNIEKSQSNVSSDPVSPQEPKNITPQNLPEDTVYCWTDKNGIKNFSDTPPAQVETFEIKKIPSDRDAKDTRVLIKENQVLVPVILGYGGKEVSTYLLLDTGATTTMIKRKIVRMLHMKSLTPGTSRVADGRSVPSDLGNLDYIIVGPHKIPNFEISVMDYQGAPVQHQGLLGMNFLREVNYRIDFRRGLISWERFD